MPFLQNEKARAQAALQKAKDDLASANAQAQAQQQTVTQIQTDVSSAQTALSNLKSQLPPLQASADSADRALSSLDSQIAEQKANEPDRIIEIPHPHPNPEWRAWKQHLDKLNAQRPPLVTNSDTSHAQLNNLNNSIAAAQSALQAANARLAQAAAPLTQLKQAVATATDKVKLAQQSVDDLNRFTTEIERDPFDRPALENTAAGLWSCVLDLEDSHRAAESASEAADEALASLISRRDELTAGLANLAGQLSAAIADVSTAEAALADIESQMNDHISGGP